MPNMNRLTWSGVALHAGDLPGYPASHGCVRLPLEFSEKMFGITEVGTPVIIADAATYPSVVAHPGMILAKNRQRDFNAVSDAVKRKQATQHTIPSKPSNSAILISSNNQEIIVMDDGVIVSKGAMSFSEPDRPLGNHVFILSSINLANKELQWRTIGYYNDSRRELELT